MSNSVITTNQPDTKSNPIPNPITKQHAAVNIQLNIVTSPTYPEKSIRDSAIAPFLLSYFPPEMEMSHLS